MSKRDISIQKGKIDSIVQEAKDHEAQREPHCKSTKVENRTDININNAIHAGIVTHRCRWPETHQDQCACACGHTWMKFLSKT